VPEAITMMKLAIVSAEEIDARAHIRGLLVWQHLFGREALAQLLT
jgi:hypothetical protein